ncbi:DUF6531 domain-containing protein [Polyangium spumosum]|uniref:Type IV secretion protein Rhs n=1 Tax=Polyangium spumosum TaxID=889282 RepID=A0A6N7Q0E9_9BACT|nr:DUF6531 domain-containing protein [Polyangium spumosum]MRG97818.1 hypothetical protein [Polyangium spumosum]
MPQPFWFKANKAGSATFVDKAGSTQTVELKPGDTFTTYDPCEMLSFVEGWNQSVSEDAPETIATLARLCGEKTGATLNYADLDAIVVGEGDAFTGLIDSTVQQSAPDAPSSGVLGGVETREEQPEGGKPFPGHSSETARQPLRVSDPVDMFSGAFVIEKVDLAIPSPLLPLAFVRSYRSGSAYPGPLGYGWDHNFNVYLRELADGSIARWNGALHEDIFRFVGDRFEPPRGVHERLEPLPGLPSTYRIVQRGGVSLRFGKPSGWPIAWKIPLVDIRDRHGSRLTLSYDGEGRLSGVHDQAGRGFAFQYGAHALLRSVEDHAGRRVTYEYYRHVQHLGRVIRPPTAQYTKGVTTLYEYDERPWHPAMRHNIVRITDAQRRRYIENVYGGLEHPWTLNRVVRQYFGDWPYIFKYEQIQHVPAGPAFVGVPALRASMQEPNLRFNVYTFNYRGDLLDYRFRLRRDKSQRVVAQRWRYDEQGNVVSETAPDGSRVAYSYDSANPNPCARGNLLKVERFAPPAYVAQSRVVFQASYDLAFQLPRETLDEAGARTRYHYDFDAGPGTGRLVRVEAPDATLPDGAVQKSATEIEPLPNGLVEAVVSAEGIRHETKRHAAGPLAGMAFEEVLDATGVAATIGIEHDAFGFVRREIDPSGAAFETVCNALGQIEEEILPHVDGVAARRRYRLDEDGLTLRIEHPRGAYTDATIADDVIVELYERNAIGHVRRHVVGANTAEPRASVFRNDHAGRPVRIEDPMGVYTLRRYDERGLVMDEAHGWNTREELKVRYVYDRAGRLTRRIDPGEIVTKHEHDPWGRIAKVFLPNGSEVRFTWGPVDRLLEATIEGEPGDGSPRRLLARSRYEHDERGRLVRERVDVFESDPAKAVELVTTYVHDRDDRLREVIGPRGERTCVEYDGLGRVVRVEDPAGNVGRAVYDDAKRTVQIVREDVSAAARTWTLVSDARGRLSTVTAPAGSMTNLVYDDRDHVVEEQGPLTVARWRYGLLGEVIEEIADPSGLGLVTRYEHDLMGRLVRLIDPTSEATTWARDLLGRVVAVSLAGKTWAYRYNALGAVEEETRPSGAKTMLAYDPATGRLAQRTATPGPGMLPVSPVELAYDGLDRVVKASTSTSAAGRRFDSLGRLVEESFAGRTFRRTFDDLAGCVRLAFPDGREEEHAVDLLGRVHRITLAKAGAALAQEEGRVLLTLDFAGPELVAAQHFGNGASAAWERDDVGRLVRVEHHGATGELLEAVRYAYDAESRRRLVQVEGAPAENHLHAFDGRNRLVEWRTGFAIDSPDEELATAASHVEAYALDDADTRKTVTVNGVVTTYASVPGHVVTHVGGEEIVHDADGLRVADGARNVVYDALGRVARIEEVATGAVLVTMMYDPFGRWTGDASVTRFHFGGACLHEESAGGVVVCQRTQHPDHLVPALELRAGVEAYLHVDGHENLVLVTDAAGVAVERVRYAPFGAPRVFDGAGAQAAGVVAPRFGAMPWIEAAELYWTPVRLYDPETGLFLARDPLTHVASPSPYVFAGHDPVNGIDPAGDIPALVVAGLGVGAISAVTGMMMTGMTGGDWKDVLAAGAIGFGAGFVAGVTSSYVGGLAMAKMLGVANGIGTTTTSVGINVASGMVGGAAGGLLSGMFSGGASGLYNVARSRMGWKQAGTGAAHETVAGAASGAVGGALFGGLLRAGTIPNGSWSALRGTSESLKREDVLRPTLMRGAVGPYGIGAPFMGFMSGYSGGIVRRGLEGDSFEQAASGALDDGAYGAASGTLFTAMHPTTWQAWFARGRLESANHIESTRAGKAHHQRNVAQYPELATLYDSPFHSIVQKLNHAFIRGNIEGRFSDITPPTGMPHASHHKYWKFGQKGIGYTNMACHGPWTPAWNVPNLPADPHRLGGKKNDG